MDCGNSRMDKSKQNQVSPIIVKPTNVFPLVRHSNYFSPAPASQWGPRVIPDIELLLIISGRFEYEDVLGNRENFFQSDLCVIMPGVEHIFRCGPSQRSVKPFFACIHLDLLHDRTLLSGGYTIEPHPPLKTKINNFAEMKELFRQMAVIFDSAGEYRDEMVISMARLIWLHLSRHWTAASGEMLSPVMQQMTAFLNERFMDPVGREDLARKFGVTPQYVNRLFRRELNMTPTEYLNRYRSTQAVEYLRQGGMKVSDVAALVGFDDPYYFSRVFKKQMGIAPSSFTQR